MSAQREQIELALSRVRRYRERARRDLAAAGPGSYQEMHATRRLGEHEEMIRELENLLGQDPPRVFDK